MIFNNDLSPKIKKHPIKKKTKHSLKNPEGRPTKIDSQILDRLNYAFSINCTDSEACLYAGIHPATLYRYQKNNPEFCERKSLLRTSMSILAKQSIIKGFEKDPWLAFKFLAKLPNCGFDID